MMMIMMIMMMMMMGNVNVRWWNIRYLYFAVEAAQWINTNNTSTHKRPRLHALKCSVYCTFDSGMLQQFCSEFSFVILLFCYCIKVFLLFMQLSYPIIIVQRDYYIIVYTPKYTPK